MPDPILMQCDLSDGDEFAHKLIPADIRAEAALAKIQPGDVVAVTIRRGRNLPQHRLFFALLQHVAKATKWEYPERLLVALKVRLGRYDLLALPNGKLAPVPHSISFAEMGQDDFQQFMDQCLGLICAEVLPGYDPATLIKEAENA